jgi:uncharacterized membrane protein YphA (DoxX/SURF4 family)
MPPKKPVLIVALILRVLLGAWFAFTGGQKLFGTGLSQFTRDIANYGLLKAPLDAAAAYTIPWFELVAGLCLVLGILRKASILTIAGLVAVFSYGVGHAWSQNLNIACGCRGGAEAMSYSAKATEFAGYFIVLVFLAWVEWRKGQPCATDG